MSLRRAYATWACGVTRRLRFALVVGLVLASVSGSAAAQAVTPTPTATPVALRSVTCVNPGTGSTVADQDAYGTCLAMLNVQDLVAAQATQTALNGAESASAASAALEVSSQNVFASAGGGAAQLALVLLFPIGVGLLLRRRVG